jgi:nicotinamide-nucleotide amidase
VSPAEDDLVAVATRLQAACLASDWTVAVAESCTGGLVSHAITLVPGSSGYFHGAVVSYSNEVKEAVLDVAAEVLDRHGAVSAQVAAAMATGARARLGTTIGAAVTGVAGPDGGSDEKPVGLVYVAVVDAAGTDVRRYRWAGDRAANIHASALAALELMLERVSEAPAS